MQAEEAHRLTSSHRVLHRPRQMWGGERELILFSMLVVGGLIVLAMSRLVMVFGTYIWLVCVYGLRKMAKIDPSMSKVYV